MKSMLIALDYDDTYSVDPTAWDGFIVLMRGHRHRVVIVTYRDDRHDWNRDLRRLDDGGVEVFFTRGAAKGWWCEHFGPGKIDVWVDDRPKSVLENSSFTPDQLFEWRAENKRKEAEAA